jgi:cytochrome bd-type quinol oxidase subunit 1
MVRSLTASFVFAVASVVAAVSPVAHAQSAGDVTPAKAAAIEAAIKDLSMQWSTAILTKDTTILERIWATGSLRSSLARISPLSPRPPPST